MDQQLTVGENTNPTPEMRTIIIPSEHLVQIPKKVERETLLERSEMERTITLVLESESPKAVSETTPLPILTPNLAPALPN